MTYDKKQSQNGIKWKKDNPKSTFKSDLRFNYIVNGIWGSNPQVWQNNKVQTTPYTL